MVRSRSLVPFEGYIKLALQEDGTSPRRLTAGRRYHALSPRLPYCRFGEGGKMGKGYVTDKSSGNSLKQSQSTPTGACKRAQAWDFKAFLNRGLKKLEKI